MSKKSPHKEITLEEWKQAVWDYLLEHSDITNGGSLFVKFHTDSRYKFENRIIARVQGYHRKDKRLGVDTREKEILHEELSKRRITTKKKKRKRWEATREERRQIMKEVEYRNNLLRYARKFPKPLRPLVHRLLEKYATARSKMLQ
jgi:hypothetical protein